MFGVELCVVAIWVLATNQAVNIWHHSHLMAPIRTRVQLDAPLPLVPTRINDHVRYLLLCPYCMSVWTAALIVATWMIGNVCQDMHNIANGLLQSTFVAVGQLFHVFILSLAVSRAANVLNDLVSPFDRTPRLPVE